MLVRRGGVFLTAIVPAMIVFVRGLPMMMRGRLVMACGRVVVFAGGMSGGHEDSKGLLFQRPGSKAPAHWSSPTRNR